MLPMAGSSAMMQMGDPFLGGFFRAIGRGLGRVLPIFGQALGITTPSIPRAPMGHGGSGIPSGGFPMLPPAQAPPMITPPRLVPPGLPRFGTGGGITVTGAPRRRRRINPLNPRALRRSLRRIEGFRKFARRAGFVPRGQRVARKLPFLRRRRKAA